MKGPKKNLSKLDYSSFVTLACMTIGVVLMGVIVIPTINSILGKIFVTIGCLVTVVVFIWSIIYQLKSTKKEEEGEEKE